jgi:hypothetical protein
MSRLRLMTTPHHSFVHLQNDSEKGDFFEMEETHSDQKVSHELVQKINFCVPRCSACKDKMQLSEGDVIYGDKWYHDSCWKEIEKMAEFVAQ